MLYMADSYNHKVHVFDGYIYLFFFIMLLCEQAWHISWDSYRTFQKWLFTLNNLKYNVAMKQLELEQTKKIDECHS